MIDIIYIVTFIVIFILVASQLNIFKHKSKKSNVEPFDFDDYKNKVNANKYTMTEVRDANDFVLSQVEKIDNSTRRIYYTNNSDGKVLKRYTVIENVDGSTSTETINYSELDDNGLPQKTTSESHTTK